MFLRFRDEFLVALRVEEDLGTFLLEARELVLQSEVAAVRTEEDVARERAEHFERAREILRDAGIGRHLLPAINEVEVRPETHAADNDDAAQLIGGFAGKVDTLRPSRATARVSGR